MSSERQRPPPLATGAESDRHYDEDEVAELLRRAAALEAKKARSHPSLSLQEIEAIAQEAGIDPALVRRAASELVTRREAGWGARLAGAPLRRVIERTVDVALTTEHHEVLAQALRESLSGTGPLPLQVSVIGRSLTVAGWNQTGAFEVSINPKDGQTVIRISHDGSQLAGGLFGGLMGGIGGGLGTNVAWMLPRLGHLPWFTGALGFAAVLGGSYWLARTIFTYRVGGLSRRLEQLADTLEDRLRPR